jgi:hypothetical protein
MELLSFSNNIKYLHPLSYQIITFNNIVHFIFNIYEPWTDNYTRSYALFNLISNLTEVKKVINYQYFNLIIEYSSIFSQDIIDNFIIKFLKIFKMLFGAILV